MAQTSGQASLFALALVFLLVAPVSGSSEDLPAVARQVVSFLLVAHDVNELQVFCGEEQPVEVVQVHLRLAVPLQSSQQSGDDGPPLLNPGGRRKDGRQFLRARISPSLFFFF